ncbi:hypothetical protein BC940DRAFT_148631 [Gongronella butleri]|nr:hypothetical protein BC940DRAFT_148631 [Gongronella butleri]
MPFRSSIQTVYSYEQQLATERRPCQVDRLRVSVWVPSPRCLLQPQVLYRTRRWCNCSGGATKTTLCSKVVCRDARTLDRILQFRSGIDHDTRRWWWQLLMHSCLLASPSKNTILVPNASYVIWLTLDPAYVDRHAQEFAYASYRFSWKVAAKEELVAFYSVYYSVLGGAYSSLGKANAKYAVKAGTLAQQQIQMAQWLQDPVLECKCWLYYAEDAIMQGQFDLAKQILTKQRHVAEKLQHPILLSMASFVQAKLRTQWKAMRRIML